MARDERFELGDLTFVWNTSKNRKNVEMHGITFDEAATSWLDPLAVEAFDDEHSSSEDRWFRIGTTLRGALVVTWWTARTGRGKDLIRIIGARRATRRERRIHEEQEF